MKWQAPNRDTVAGFAWRDPGNIKEPQNRLNYEGDSNLGSPEYLSSLTTTSASSVNFQ
jgi:hypothetical protein